jgi:hypothetical protein
VRHAVDKEVRNRVPARNSVLPCQWNSKNYTIIIIIIIVVSSSSGSRSIVVAAAEAAVEMTKWNDVLMVMTSSTAKLIQGR